MNGRTESGFSLTELVAALAIFSVGVLACVELYTIAFRSTVDSMGYTQAVFLAEGLLEETLADGYLSADTDSGDFGESYPRHSWETEIEDTDQTGLMKVRIVVKWESPRGEKEYELTTLHADRDTAPEPTTTSGAPSSSQPSGTSTP